MGKPNPLGDPLESIGKYGGENLPGEGGEFYQPEQGGFFYKLWKKGKNYIVPAGITLSLVGISAAELGDPEQQALEQLKPRNAVVSVQKESYLEKAAQKVADFLASPVMAEECTGPIYLESSDLSEAHLTALENVLNDSGIATTEYPEEACKRVRVSVTYKQPDCDIPSSGICVNSALVTIKYISPDGTSRSVKFSKIDADYLDRFIGDYGNSIAGYLGNGRRASLKGAEATAKGSPDEITVQIDGKWRNLKKWEGVMDRSIKDGIEKNDPETIKRLNKLGFEVRNKEVYEIK